MHFLILCGAGVKSYQNAVNFFLNKFIDTNANIVHDYKRRHRRTMH